MHLNPVSASITMEHRLAKDTDSSLSRDNAARLAARQLLGLAHKDLLTADDSEEAPDKVRVQDECIVFFRASSKGLCLVECNASILDQTRIAAVRAAM